MRPDTKRNRLEEQQVELTLNKLVIVQAYTGCEPKFYSLIHFTARLTNCKEFYLFALIFTSTLNTVT